MAQPLSRPNHHHGTALSHDKSAGKHVDEDVLEFRFHGCLMPATSMEGQNQSWPTATRHCIHTYLASNKPKCQGPHNAMVRRNIAAGGLRILAASSLNLLPAFVLGSTHQIMHDDPDTWQVATSALDLARNGSGQQDHCSLDLLNGFELVS